MSNVPLRVYLIAHAPSDPHPWFEPTYPPMPAADFSAPTHMTASERTEWEGMGEWLDLDQLNEPRIRDYYERRLAHERRTREWEAGYSKARYVQWPSAWADEQLRLINSGHN